MDEITRRRLFAAGALGAAAAAGPASAAALTALEAANLKQVQDFCATWSAADFDPDTALAAYLAPDARVRVIDSQPFVTGPAAAAAAFKAFMPNGERVKVKYLSTLARGPLVVTQRIDTMLTPGKPDQDFEVVGVFLLKDGKIREWTDYVV